MTKHISKFSAISIAFVWLVFTDAHANELFTLSVDQWDRPHDDKAVIAMPPLPELVKTWSAKKQENADAKIEVRYPGGEMGELLAKRLYDWLVVLGIPSSEIILSPGSASVTQLELLVI